MAFHENDPVKIVLTNQRVCARLWKYYMYVIPYSGKFSLVQNFAELHVSPSEEIFVVLFSRLLHVETTPRPINCMDDITRFLHLFKISRFLFSRHPAYPRKMRKFAPCENFPLYGTYTYEAFHMYFTGISYVCVYTNDSWSPLCDLAFCESLPADLHVHCGVWKFSSTNVFCYLV
jgi:hypothetical protein